MYTDSSQHGQSQLPVMSGSYSTLAPMACPAGCCALQISLRNQLLVANDW